MWVIVVSIALFLFYKLVIRFFIDDHRDSKSYYHTIPPEVQRLIDRKDAESLAKLLVGLAVEGEDILGGHVLRAIDSKGVVFATKVDKYRNQMRIRAGLGPLRYK